MKLEHELLLQEHMRILNDLKASFKSEYYAGSITKAKELEHQVLKQKDTIIDILKEALEP